MKHKIYLSDSIEVLSHEQLIGEANSYQEACRVIDGYLAINNFHQDPYWRIIMGDIATFIDYGSWSRFAAIVPPVNTKELIGEE